MRFSSSLLPFPEHLLTQSSSSAKNGPRGVLGRALPEISSFACLLRSHSARMVHVWSIEQVSSFNPDFSLSLKSTFLTFLSFARLLLQILLRFDLAAPLPHLPSGRPHFPQPRHHHFHQLWHSKISYPLPTYGLQLASPRRPVGSLSRPPSPSACDVGSSSRPVEVGAKMVQLVGEA